MREKLDRAKELIDQESYAEAFRLLEDAASEYATKPVAGTTFAAPFQHLANVYRKQKAFDNEIRLLEIYVSSAGQNPTARHQWYLIDRLDEARGLAARYVPERGVCEMCDKSGRVLTRIESGQAVCKSCLQELSPPPRPPHLASLQEIKWLRRDGFEVPDDLTKDQVSRLYALQRAQAYGLNVSFDASEEEIDAAIEGIVKTFQTKLVGVTHINTDGSSRQAAIEDCRIGELLVLIREPDNAYDSRAVKVCRKTGEQLGYLKASILGNDQGIGWCVADHIDGGTEYQVAVESFEDFKTDEGEFVTLLLTISYRPYVR